MTSADIQLLAILQPTTKLVPGIYLGSSFALNTFVEINPAELAIATLFQRRSNPNLVFVLQMTYPLPLPQRLVEILVVCYLNTLYICIQL